MHLSRKVWAFAVVALIAASPLLAQDWPQWRGPGRDAKAAGFTPPKAWPKELTQKWKVSVGEGVATPALVGDKLYVFSRQQGNEVLRCLNASDGKELWQDKYESQGASGPASGYSGPRSSPAVGEGKVVTIGVRGVISCVDAGTGKVIWRKDDFKSTPNFFTSSSPMILDGLCIAQLGGRDNGAVVAYELADGNSKWKWSGDSPGYASPVLMTIGQTKLVIAMTERRIVAINAADGKLAWETPFAAQGMGAYNAATPLVDGQVLVYSGGGRGTRAVRIEQEGDKFTGKELWNNSEKSVQFNTPVIKDGLLYGLSQSNELFCIDMKTGKTAWGANIGAGGGGGAGFGGGGGGGFGRPGGGMRGRGGGRGGYGSIVDAGSVLLALTPASELIVFSPGDKEFTQVAKIKVADSGTYAYPIASGGRIFVKDQDAVTLWALE